MCEAIPLRRCSDRQSDYGACADQHRRTGVSDIWCLLLLNEIVVEEKHLREMFRSHYDSYAQTTAKVIPGIYCSSESCVLLSAMHCSGWMPW
jgi:hypothetical protein